MKKAFFDALLKKLIVELGTLMAHWIVAALRKAACWAWEWFSKQYPGMAQAAA
jgi:hypothetical protein